MKRNGARASPWSTHPSIRCYHFCSPVGVHVAYSTKPVGWNTISFQDFHHFTTTYGVKHFLEVTKREDHCKVILFDSLNYSSKSQDLSKCDSFWSEIILVDPQLRINGTPDSIQYHAVEELCYGTCQTDASIVIHVGQVVCLGNADNVRK